MTKTVLITGCSSGFGLASANFFSLHGWNVVATMRHPDNAPSPLIELPNVSVERLDVQERASIDAAIEAGVARFGRIDAIVNNAGFGLFGLFESTSLEKIREQFDVNVFGVMDVTRAIIPHFRANNGGRIINISSGAGVFTLPMLSLYCASKFALEGFSEALSYELLSQNIIVKIVEPGGVTATNFGVRSASEAATAAAHGDYAHFVDGVAKIFGGLREVANATTDDVARIIYEAATDESERFSIRCYGRYQANDERASGARRRQIHCLYARTVYAQAIATA